MKKRIVLILLVMFNITTFGQENRPFLRPLRKYLNQEARVFLQPQEGLEEPKYYLDNGSKYEIKLVFHLINSGEVEKEINKQVKILNKAFEEIGVTKDIIDNNDEIEYKKSATEIGIKFSYHNDPSSIISSSSQEKVYNELFQPMNGAKGGFPPINNTNVVNVYVCTLPTGTAGYASPPKTTSEYDGIVISKDFFGSGSYKEYDKGYTLVHLMGIYLGLKELWNDKETCKDDGVADTPIHHAPNYNISKREKTRYITACPCFPDGIMYMNFMDNTDDAFLEMFTQGQKNLMRYNLGLNGPRSQLARNSKPGRIAAVEGNDEPNEEEIMGLSIFPNPNNGSFELAFNSTEGGSVQIRIYSNSGNEILEIKENRQVGKNKILISSSKLTRGEYILKMTLPSNLQISKKLIIL